MAFITPTEAEQIYENFLSNTATWLASDTTKVMLQRLDNWMREAAKLQSSMLIFPLDKSQQFDDSPQSLYPWFYENRLRVSEYLSQYGWLVIIQEIDQTILIVDEENEDFERSIL